MKRKSLAILVSFVMSLLFIIPSTASAKVYWNGAELKKGQIGLLTILQQTELYKLNGSTKTITRTLHPGEVYRIYTFLPGRLGVGGGYYIDRDSRIKYQTPSKEKLQALGVKTTKNQYQGKFNYPQVAGLISKAAQDKINAAITAHIKDSYTNYLALKAQEAQDRQAYEAEYGHPVPPDEDYMYTYEYDVYSEIRYNENNQLSILLYDYVYMGGAHGGTLVTSYNFNALTGQRLLLGDVAKSSTALGKIKRYAITDLTNRAHRGNGEGIFEEFLKEMDISNNRPFYYSDNGIVLKFQEYEVAAYAAGMPEVKVPYKVFR